MNYDVQQKFGLENPNSRLKLTWFIKSGYLILNKELINRRWSGGIEAEKTKLGSDTMAPNFFLTRRPRDKDESMRQFLLVHTRDLQRRAEFFLNTFLYCTVIVKKVFEYSIVYLHIDCNQYYTTIYLKN